MDNIITVRRLWDNGELATPGFCTISVNCNMLTGGTPRLAWITPAPGCNTSNGYLLNLVAPNPLPGGTLQGIYLAFVDGTDMVVDAISVDAVIAACNACCGGSGIVPSRYAGTIPEAPDQLAATYVIERTDNGGDYAYQRASLAYWPYYIPGTFAKVSHDDLNGSTQYSFQAYTDPVLIGSDNLISESDRVATSNEIPNVSGSQVLVLTFNGPTGVIVPSISAATPAALVTALNANAAYNELGTWAYDSNLDVITLTTDTLTSGTITIAAKEPQEFISNDPGAPTGSQQVQLSAVIDGIAPAPVAAATVTALATALNANANYSKFGTWAAQGTAIKLTSAIINNAQLQLSLTADL
jgi:hypothetical protein